MKGYCYCWFVHTLSLFSRRQTAQKLQLNTIYLEQTADRGSLQTYMDTGTTANSQTRCSLDLESM